MTKNAFFLCILVVLAVAACTNQTQSQEHVNIATPSPAVPASVPPVIPVTVSQSPESPLSDPTKENIGSLSSEDKQLTRVGDLVLYPELPPYEVWYDANIWRFSENEEPGLTNLENPSCYLSLRGKPQGADPLDTVWLAGHEWTIYTTGSENSIAYSITVGGGGYLFRVDLPRPYQAGDKSICQQLAQEVIDTFTIMD